MFLLLWNTPISQGVQQPQPVTLPLRPAIRLEAISDDEDLLFLWWILNESY